MPISFRLIHISLKTAPKIHYPLGTTNKYGHVSKKPHIAGQFGLRKIGKF